MTVERGRQGGGKGYGKGPQKGGEWKGRKVNYARSVVTVCSSGEHSSLAPTCSRENRRTGFLLRCKFRGRQPRRCSIPYRRHSLDTLTDLNEFPARRNTECAWNCKILKCEPNDRALLSDELRPLVTLRSAFPLYFYPLITRVSKDR